MHTPEMFPCRSSIDFCLFVYVRLQANSTADLHVYGLRVETHSMNMQLVSAKNSRGVSKAERSVSSQTLSASFLSLVRSAILGLGPKGILSISLSRVAVPLEPPPPVTSDYYKADLNHHMMSPLLPLSNFSQQQQEVCLAASQCHNG